MIVVAIGWLFAVGMFALVHALSPQGTLLGALLSLVFVGLLPLAVVLYLMAAPARRRARHATDSAAPNPHQGSHAPGDAVAPKREEA
jgi:membrane protein implicated in regulation of membrane protease activity